VFGGRPCIGAAGTVALEREPGPERIAGQIHPALPLGPVIVFDIEASDRTPLRLTATREVAAQFGAVSPGERVHVALAAAGACSVFAEAAPMPEGGS